MTPRPNLQIKIGSYVGDGNDSKVISGVGFKPDLVLIKGGSNISMFRTRTFIGDTSGYSAGNTAHEADNIQELIPDGFVLGTNAKVNANGTTYYYIAIRGKSSQNHFRTGRYVGNASDSRNYTDGLFFTPDFAFTKRNGADNGSFRTSVMGADNSGHFSGSADAANEIQSLITNGFQLGTSTRVNGSTEVYDWFALKSFAGVFAVGTYTGDALDNKAITGLGFSPDVVIIKNGSTTNAAYILTSSVVSGGGLSFGAAGQASDSIKSLNADGFTLGTNSVVNGSGNTFWWIAFKAGDFIVPTAARTAS